MWHLLLRIHTVKNLGHVWSQSIGHTSVRKTKTIRLFFQFAET